MNGYSLVSGSCIKCPEGALTCTATDKAATCMSGYSLFNFECISCGTNAKTCGPSLVSNAC